MKKLLLFTAALVIFSGVYAKKVMFQVDMTGKTISANGLHIAGNFQAAAGAGGDWMPAATALTNGGSGNIYSVIVDIPAMTSYEFKFINDNNWGSGEEAIPTISQKGSAINGGSNGNRWVFIDSLANDTTILPAILFGGSAPAGLSAVRFAVDLQKEASVSANGVHIAGDIQGWNPAASSMANLFTNNKIYEYIAYLDTNSHQFKYVNGNAWSGAEGVPSNCATGGNRTVQTYTDVAVAKVCFSQCVACPTAPIPQFKMTFNVDMLNNDCFGGFDSVTVAGAGTALTNYGSGIKLIQVGTTSIYTLQLTLDSGSIVYKYRYHKNNNTNWEGGITTGSGNREFTLTNDTVLAPVCFGQMVGACVAKPAPSTITFKVDMTNEIPDADGKIYVEGTFTQKNWKDGAIRLAPSPGQPGVYFATVPNVCLATFQYKFENGDSSKLASEENFPDTTQRACLSSNGIGGFNRSYTRISANPITLYFTYNKCKIGSNVGINEVNVLANNIKLYPNPTNNYTVVEFNDKAASHDITVTDITGKVLRTYSDQKFNTMRIDRENLKDGIYFIGVKNSNGESKVIKLFIQ